ncbi:MAG: hypothetical protein LBI35_02235 [Burkholderiales bacterium]|jgi:hypothetical protein|nr:hypothetical protein [Burkholderiales bacterium]
MLKGISVVFLSFLHGAILGWFFGYAVAYFKMGFHIRRVYLDAQKHFFIASAIATAGLIVFFIIWIGGCSILLPKKVELYNTPFFIATMLFWIARAMKMSKDHDRYQKNWPQSVGQLETISYGSKRFKLSFLTVVIVLLVLIFI